MCEDFNTNMDTDFEDSILPECFCEYTGLAICKTCPYEDDCKKHTVGE